jgi:hypothetical protein
MRGLSDVQSDASAVFRGFRVASKRSGIPLSKVVKRPVDEINPYDPERHVWLVDDGTHSIDKFTNDGKKLVMTLGEFKVPGNDEKHFGRPTEIAWLPDGTFFVTASSSTCGQASVVRTRSSCRRTSICGSRTATRRRS